MADPELDLDALGTLVASATGAGRYRFVLADSGSGITADALEKGGGKGAAGILLDEEVPDAGGKGELALAGKKDDLKKKVEALKGAAPRVATFVVATPKGEGGAPKATAGPVLKVRMPTIIEIELDIDPADPASGDDKITLKADDGSFEETKTVKDDVTPGDRKTTLRFTIPPGKGSKYSVRVDPGKEGAPYWLVRAVDATQAS